MNFEHLWQRAKTFNILQKKQEFKELVNFLDIELYKKDAYLEIGTNWGGTSSIFLKMFKSGYSIDLEYFPENVQRLRQINSNFHQIIADSHSDEAFNWVKSLGIKFDMIMIDGDHTAAGCECDYLTYKQFLQPWGKIIFHDICENTVIAGQPVEVKKVWEHYSRGKHKAEIINNYDRADCGLTMLNERPLYSWGGIGLLSETPFYYPGIVITTHESTKQALAECMSALQGCKFPITIVMNNNHGQGFEMSGLLTGSKLYTEFLYMHDTVIIKDLSILDKLFYEYRNKSVSFMQRYNSYLGKYKSNLIKRINVPYVFTKQMAIHYERVFNELYIYHDVMDYIELFPELDGWETEHNNFQERYGRQNVVYENDYFAKYKGCWHPSMATD